MDLEPDLHNLAAYAEALVLIGSSPHQTIDQGAVFVVASDLKEAVSDLKAGWKAALDRARGAKRREENHWCDMLSLSAAQAIDIRWIIARDLAAKRSFRAFFACAGVIGAVQLRSAANCASGQRSIQLALGAARLPGVFFAYSTSWSLPMRSAAAERRTVARVRVPIELDEADVTALDRWARRNDFVSRNAAVRALIRRAARAENARAAG